MTHPSPSVPETAAVPLTPLDEALLLVFQKAERRTIAFHADDFEQYEREHDYLKLAVADYHQLLREGGNG